MPFSLKRLASSLGCSAQKELAPVSTGWDSLPEDIFNLMIEDSLKLDHKTLTSLSQTCRSYATLCRPRVFRSIHVVSGPDDETAKQSLSQLEQFKRDLKHYPRLIAIVGTLRITNTNRNMQLSKLGPRPSLTKDGESLLYILSQTFPHLKSLELPLLQWSILPVKLQDAICSFLRRHPLRKLSITVHYPLELVKHCQTITKLECRLYDTHPPLELINKSLQEAHRSQAAPTALEELIIQDTFSQIVRLSDYLVQPDASIELKKLKRLTYYGFSVPFRHLCALLGHCSESLTSLRIYVSDQGYFPMPNLLALRRLERLTLSVDRTREGKHALTRIIDAIKLLFSNSTCLPPLQCLEVVVRVSGEMVVENIREMNHGWHCLKTTLADASTKYAPAWNLRELNIIVCADETKLEMLDPSAILSGLRSYLVPIFGSSMPEAAVDVQLIEDKYSRWLRFPVLGRAPPH